MKKPFNYEEALAGKPVITRDGRKVFNLQKFNAEIREPLFGIIDGSNQIDTWSLDGKYLEPGLLSFNDLFMASTLKKGFVAVGNHSINYVNYRQRVGFCTNVWSTESEAKREFVDATSNEPSIIIPVSWEE